MDTIQLPQRYDLFIIYKVEHKEYKNEDFWKKLFYLKVIFPKTTK